VSADLKPPQRLQASTRQWVELRKQKLGPCRICGQVPATLHHLVSRSLRGSDVAENLVPLCGSGTHGCHGAVEARRPDALKALRDNLRADELKYILNTKGADYLERYLPLSDVA
jgi:5-methylcytosine-specific restriction endonuclease McrA